MMSGGNGDIGLAPVRRQIQLPGVAQLLELADKVEAVALEIEGTEDATLTQRALALLLVGQAYNLKHAAASLAHQKQMQQERIARPQIVVPPNGFRRG